MISTNEKKRKKIVSLSLEQFMNTETENNTGNENSNIDKFAKDKIGVITSPSSTISVTVDILESCFNKKLLGQLVYYNQKQDNSKMYVIGQLTSMETRNRWHEDMNFRPMVKRIGRLNNLSITSDIKTAILTVQSSFLEDGNGNIKLSLLGTSPTTSTPLYIVSNELLDHLLNPYKDLLVYLGYIFETQVAMPTWFKHFGRDPKDPHAAGEAYHIGVFGKTGSGKSVLSAYILLAYALNKNMSILIIDPQGQFSKNLDFGFDWHAELSKMGREPLIIDASTDLYLEKKDLFPLLLNKIGFYRQLGIKHPINQQYAIEELQKYIRLYDIKLSTGPSTLLWNFLEYLLNDNIIGKIYSTKTSQERVINLIKDIRDNKNLYEDLRTKYWDPILSLFTKMKPHGTKKYSVRDIAYKITNSEPSFIIINISKTVKGIQNDEDIKTIYLGRIIRWIDRIAQENYEKDIRSNALVVMDEAQKFLSPRAEQEEIAILRQHIINGVKTHRKYGIGYMLITQNISSLDRDILSQLRIYFIGYGLVGADLAKLKDILPDPKTIDFYRSSFIDPKNTNNTKFPFMFFGPVSPLSFSGTPLFMHVFTNIEEFRHFNAHRY